MWLVEEILLAGGGLSPMSLVFLVWIFSVAFPVSLKCRFYGMCFVLLYFHPFGRFFLGCGFSLACLTISLPYLSLRMGSFATLVVRCVPTITVCTLNCWFYSGGFLRFGADLCFVFIFRADTSVFLSTVRSCMTPPLAV